MKRLPMRKIRDILRPRANDALAPLAGEGVFVDYAGPTTDVVCDKSGETHTAEIFSATLGASNLT